MTLKSILNNLWRDSRGLLLSTDLMLSMVLMTITLGMTANAMDMATNPLQDYSSRSSMENTALEASDLLINTPGSPGNWEEYNNSFAVSPGLAKINPSSGETMSHVISYDKLSALNRSYEYLMEDKVFPEYMDSSISIYPLNSNLKPITIHEDFKARESSEVVVVNRTIMLDYEYLNCTLNISSDMMSTEDCNLNPTTAEICFHEEHKSPIASQGYLAAEKESCGDIWICKHINITAESLNTTDYYLILENRGVDNEKLKWILDSSEKRINEEREFSGSPLKLNEQMLTLIGDNKQTVLWLHVKCANPGKFNVYVVAAPKNRPLKNEDLVYLNPQPCYLILKVWLNS